MVVDVVAVVVAGVFALATYLVLVVVGRHVVVRVRIGVVNVVVPVVMVGVRVVTIVVAVCGGCGGSCRCCCFSLIRNRCCR